MYIYDDAMYIYIIFRISKLTHMLIYIYIYVHILYIHMLAYLSSVLYMHASYGNALGAPKSSIGPVCQDT
jgi:hypothetical protein